MMLFVLPLFYSLILGVNDPSNRPVIAVDGLNLVVIYVAGTAALLWAVARGKMRGATICLLATALVVLDLFGATASFNPSTDDVVSGYRHPQAIAFLQQRMHSEEPFRISSTTLAWQPDLAEIAGLNDAGGLFDPMQLASYKRVVDAMSSGSAPQLYNLLNVRYLITDSKADAPSPDFVQALRTDDGLIIWENQKVMPRAWLAYDAVPTDINTALDAVTASGFKPEATLYLSGSLAAPESGGSGSADVVSSGNDQVTLTVRTNRRASLVLADTAYPGWVATVDGVDTPIATADGIFRAISVPSGTHEVVFQFKPSIVTQSWLVALASLMLLIAAAAAGTVQFVTVRPRAIYPRPR
jgi:Bacterial membrane protein YfhO